MTAEKINGVSVLLAELRGLIDERERLAEEDRRLSKRKSEIESSLLSFHDASGLEQMAGAGLTVRFDPAATRVRYDPEKWDSVVAWAVQTKNFQIIQRRTSDAKVMSLIEEGVALPEGLSIETFTGISVRRK